MTDRLTITFTPLAGSGPEHASPGRVIGALLAGAHRSGDVAAVEAVRALTALEQPQIVLPHREAVFSHTAASTPNPGPGWDAEVGMMVPSSAGGLSKMDTMTPATARSADLSEVHREHVSGDYVFYARDPEGSVDREALRTAAAHVSHFGGGPDLALCRIGDEAPEQGVTLWEPAVSPRLGLQLRVWSPELVGWYDDQYEAVFGPAALRSSHLIDRRVRTAGWVRIKRGVGEPRVVLGVSGAGRSQRSLAAMLSQVLGTTRALPMIDGRGLVRGISVPAADPVELASSASWYDPMAPEMATTDPRSWVGTGKNQLWVSATPIIAHGDPGAARWQACSQLPPDAEVLDFRTEPWHKLHGGRDKAIAVPPGMSRYWAVVRAAQPAEMVLGEDLGVGSGLMRPLTPTPAKQKETRR